MAHIGYKLSSEEHGPRALVDNARRAEEAGFEFALISDHYHPWIDRQGESPFVWGVLGAIAEVTETIKIGTSVTCPTIRIHPAIVAQASATAASLLEGRFILGVGSGENLNEHILGDHWPPAHVRLDMLEEAVDLIRKLWEGSLTTHHGKHYTVENARIYSLPDAAPPIYVGASGHDATTLAGKIGDGLISTAPDEETIKTFESNGGSGKPRYAEVQVCWAADEGSARKTALEWWPNVAMGGQLGQELALPSLYEAVAETVREEDVIDSVACGPDPELHLEMLRRFTDAGFDHLIVHQIGPDQEGFFRFYAEQVLPKV